MARAPKKPQPKPLADLPSRIAARWGGAGGEVALDRMASELGDEQRYDIVAALKELEKAGAGTFEVGRAGRKARFLWAGKRPARGKKTAAKVPVTGAAPTAQDHGRLELSSRVKLAAGHARASERSGELEHRFHLRPGFVASVRLPSDLTGSEIARFCQFLQALPFAR